MMICKREDCCGCEVCSFICPHNAIVMADDERGFSYPVINIEQCTNCGLCVKKCPINYRDTAIITPTDTKKVYAAFAKDKTIRKTSSSGGVFSILADEIISRGGLVFGVKWNDNLVAIHDYCDNKNDLREFRSSKYVQSNINNSYIKVKQYLESGRLVLFSGTPCQVEALLQFLHKKYDNLITIDIVCHGVPSSLVWKDYLGYLNEKYGDKINAVRFREKRPSWLSSSMKYSLVNEKDIYIPVVDDPYFVGFTSNLFLRDSCHKCRFSNVDRCSDITLADFWGHSPKKMKFVDEAMKGVSLMIINSVDGNSLLNTVIDKLELELSDIFIAKSGNKNLVEPQDKNVKSEIFWNDFLKGNYDWSLLIENTEIRLYKYNKYRFWFNYQLKTFLKIVLPYKLIQRIKLN
jgi:coenzyme F420-reducing hydrogenase beta subunit